MITFDKKRRFTTEFMPAGSVKTSAERWARPYEGSREMHDITGFASKEGEPLPNDDLDLQLAWLRAVDELGPQTSTQDAGRILDQLGDAALERIRHLQSEHARRLLPPPPAKSTTKNGSIPTAPDPHRGLGLPLPRHGRTGTCFAYEDASVDHGFGEGHLRRHLVAAMESAAFVIQGCIMRCCGSAFQDPRRPPRCPQRQNRHQSLRSRRSVAGSAPAGGADSADLGWFQAPANVAFVVLGLLYGQRFQGSPCCMQWIAATTRTAPAQPSVSAARHHEGHGRNSARLARLHWRRHQEHLPDQRTRALPAGLHRADRLHRKPVASDDPRSPSGSAGWTRADCFGDKDDFSAVRRGFLRQSFCGSAAGTQRLLYTIEGVYADVLVEFNVRPQIEPNGTLAGFISLTPHTMPEQKSFRLRWLLPEGWRAKREESLYLRRAFNFPQPRLHRVYADSR